MTQLAEWSCKHVRDTIEERGDQDKWVASFDGFYLTRGHYSNNSSATIHDYYGGGVAWFTHRTKTGPGHNWEGTSGGAEGDMLEEVLSKVNGAYFVIKELVTDKDSTTNAIFCRHFPEGTVTYCSNHCTKYLHKQLEKLKKNKCEVYCAFEIFNVSYVFLNFIFQCRTSKFHCKRMPEEFLNHCKASLSNLIASDDVQKAEDPLASFSEAIMNFYSHYCLDDHTSKWCHHNKVVIIVMMILIIIIIITQFMYSVR